MKQKMIAVLALVVVCLGALALEGVSQPPPSPSIAPVGAPVSAPTPSTGSPAAPDVNFSIVKPVQREWTFEQLVEALKAVRARQKELQAQEADLLAKIAEKVEEKRKDLGKSEEVLQKLRGEQGFYNGFAADPLLRKSEEKRIDKKDDKK
jgi:hypothetical protein